MKTDPFSQPFPGDPWASHAGSVDPIPFSSEHAEAQPPPLPVTAKEARKAACIAKYGFYLDPHGTSILADASQSFYRPPQARGGTKHPLKVKKAAMGRVCTWIGLVAGEVAVVLALWWIFGQWQVAALVVLGSWWLLARDALERKAAKAETDRLITALEKSRETPRFSKN